MYFKHSESHLAGSWTSELGPGLASLYQHSQASAGSPGQRHLRLFTCSASTVIGARGLDENQTYRRAANRHGCPKALVERQFGETQDSSSVCGLPERSAVSSPSRWGINKSSASGLASFLKPQKRNVSERRKRYVLPTVCAQMTCRKMGKPSARGPGLCVFAVGLDGGG